MTKKKDDPSEPRKVLVRLDCNTERLYGPLEGAIAYLEEVRAEHPTATLDEHWTGYESMEMTFSYERDETPEEIADRLERDRQAAERAARAREEEKAKAKRRQEYERLRREFG